MGVSERIFFTASGKRQNNSLKEYVESCKINVAIMTIDVFCVGIFGHNIGQK